MAVGVRGGGLLGFPPRQSSTSFRLVEGDGGPSGGLQGLLPTQSSTSFRRGEGDEGLSGGDLQGFSPTQSSTAFRRGEDDGGPCGGLQSFPPSPSSTAFGRAESGGLPGFHPGQSFQPSHELIAVTPAPGGDPQDFLPAQGSEAIFGGGRPVGGPQNFVTRQISTEFGGADDDDDLIRRSNELLEYTRHEYLLSSDEEEEEEEERGPALAIPRPFPAEALLPALVPGAHVRALVRRAPPGRAGTVVMGSVAALVFDDVGMFMAGFACGDADHVVFPLVLSRPRPRSSSITAVVWLAGFASRCVTFECRQALAALIVDNGSAMACWFYLALCSLRLMAGCRARRRHRQSYVHGWLCWYAVFFV